MKNPAPYLIDKENLKSKKFSDLPHNIDAEQQLLGAIIRNNNLVEKCINNRLENNHFFAKHHGLIYEKISKMTSSGKGASIVFLKTYFESDDEFNWDEYFETLVMNAAPNQLIDDLSIMIYDLALRRQLIDTAEFLEYTSYDLSQEDKTANDIIEETENKLFQIEESGKSEKGFIEFERSLIDSLDAAEAARKSPESLTGLSTGFSSLDKVVGGLQKSDLIILAGRPAMGKTALATNVAFNIAKNFDNNIREDKIQTNKDGDIISSGGVVAFFSLEMSAEQLTTRIISGESGISSKDIRSGNIKESDHTKYMKTGENLKSIPLYIDQTGSISIGVLATRARRLARTLKTSKNQDLALIVVDYIQLAVTSSGRYRDSRVQEIAEITQGLKTLAKDLKIPILALSQLSRQVESRDNKKPILSDLRESGAIEQDADIVMFVYREEYYLNNEQPPVGTEQHINWQARMDDVHGKADILVRKHRHGPTGEVTLQFNQTLTRFSDLAKEEHLPDRYE